MSTHLCWQRFCKESGSAAPLLSLRTSALAIHLDSLEPFWPFIVSPSSSLISFKSCSRVLGQQFPTQTQTLSKTLNIPQPCPEYSRVKYVQTVSKINTSNSMPFIAFHPFSDSAFKKKLKPFQTDPNDPNDLQCNYPRKCLLPIQFPGTSPNDLCLLEKSWIHARSAASQVKRKLPQSRPHVASRPAGDHWRTVTGMVNKW